MSKLPQPIPYLAEPFDHPFTEIVENYLKSIGIPAEEIRTIEPGVIQWTFFCDPRLSVGFSLHKDVKHNLHVYLEVAFGSVPNNLESDKLSALLRRNSEHYFPLWYAITSQSMAVIQFRCYAAGITSEHLEIRLQSILQLATESHHLFTNSEFGLLPLPEAWFKKPTLN